MKLLSFLFAVMFLSGCTTYGEDYVMHIDPNFDKTIPLILNALDDWSVAVGVSLSPVIGSPIHCTDPGNICIHIGNEDKIAQEIGHPSPDGTWTGVTVRNYRDYASIWILDSILDPPPYDPIYNSQPWYVAQETIAHEMGHAFGLQHDPHPGTLMCKDVGCGSIQVTCLDKRQYFNLRGTDYYCE
jgi:hypothetical protein